MANLKGKRVLVTGGAGFIGSHIVDLLCDEGCVEIVALDNMVRGRPENLKHASTRGPVRLVHGDIRDAKLMAPLVKGLVALLCELYDGATPAEVASIEPEIFPALHLDRQLSPTRLHGLASVRAMIRAFAQSHLQS